ncbi:hypothetical protein [Prosthecobacter sp.]|uniref:hypothetical protein n=1 Tax=Prosthecobacter sp. TaxID=1965333 RepID=UPI003784C0CC
MAWKDAKAEGTKWADEKLPADLRGQVLQLVNFETDFDSRFFYPDRSAQYHSMITNAIARNARKRGAKTVYATITPSAYMEWQTGQGKEDSKELRLKFIESCHFLSANA